MYTSHFLAGATSATLTAALLQPFDVIRTVQQGQHAALGARAGVAVPGPLATARAVVSAGGARALWRGLEPTIARVFLGAGVYFSCIHALRDALRDTQRLSDGAAAFLAGASARTLAASLLSPVAVVKTRMEWAGAERAAAPLPYRSTLGGVRHIARVEGVGALYAGLLPTIVRDSPFSGVYYAIYSWLKRV